MNKMNKMEKLEKLGRRILATGEVIACSIEGGEGPVVQGRETHIQHSTYSVKKRSRFWRIVAKSTSYKGLDLVEEQVSSVKREK